VITAIVTVQGGVVILLSPEMFLLTLMLMLNKEELRIRRCVFVGKKGSHLEGDADGLSFSPRMRQAASR